MDGTIWSFFEKLIKRVPLICKKLIHGSYTKTLSKYLLTIFDQKIFDPHPGEKRKNRNKGSFLHKSTIVKNLKIEICMDVSSTHQTCTYENTVFLPKL